jgi:protein TonB
MTQAARAIAPDSVRVSFLTTQITRERERVMRAQARQQLQQQQNDELDRQQQLIATARDALTAGNLDEAARLIKITGDGGVDQAAVDTLIRDLQGARLIAKMNEALAKPAPVPAIETAPVTAAQLAPLAAAKPAAPAVTDVVSASTLERLKYVEPEYPLAARTQGTSGWVDLAFDVGTDGAVSGIVVLAAEPRNIFDSAAVVAVRKWRYRPVQRDGQAVVRRAQLRIRFTVQ